MKTKKVYGSFLVALIVGLLGYLVVLGVVNSRAGININPYVFVPCAVIYLAVFLFLIYRAFFPIWEYDEKGITWLNKFYPWSHVVSVTKGHILNAGNPGLSITKYSVNFRDSRFIEIFLFGTRFHWLVLKDVCRYAEESGSGAKLYTKNNG